MSISKYSIPITLGVAGGIGLWFFVSSSGFIQFIQPRANPITTLLAGDQDFKQGWELSRQGKYTEAIAAYDKAYRLAETPEKQAQIKYLIASIYKITESYELAIDEFREIASNAAYPPLFRTFAINEALLTAIDFGDFTHSHGNAEKVNPGELHPVAAALFTYEPYATYLRESKNDPALTARKVYEYASTFYPSAVSEMGQAQWYTNELYGYYARDEQSNTRVPEYVSIVKDKLARSEPDVNRSIRNIYETVTVSPALINMGFAHEVLFLLGYGSVQDAERYYKKAVDVNDVTQTQGGVVYYAKLIYASFLGRTYGEERAAEIATLLKDFNLSNKEFPPDMKQVLKNMITKPMSEYQDKGRYAMFHAAPDFRKFLVSLGISSDDIGGKGESSAAHTH
jgi:tetratricopeptide (TPR) repeat protein